MMGHMLFDTNDFSARDRGPSQIASNLGRIIRLLARISGPHRVIEISLPPKYAALKTLVGPNCEICARAEAIYIIGRSSPISRALNHMAIRIHNPSSNVQPEP